MKMVFKLGLISLSSIIFMICIGLYGLKRIEMMNTWATNEIERSDSVKKLLIRLDTLR